MKWTLREKRELRRQIKEGVPVENIRVGERTLASIRYQIYALGFHFKWWKKSEIKLLKNLIQSGKNPWEISIPGKTKNAIRNKAIRTGIWKTQTRCIHQWHMGEVRELIHLVLSCGYTSGSLFRNERFPGRSKDYIAQQLRRLRRKNLI